MKDKNTIIIKRVKKQSEEADHGGSWKVAYADFVTALMTFFLLMRLLAILSPQKKESIASYFKEFNIFKESGQSFMGKSSEVFDEGGKVPRGLQGTFNLNPEEFKEILKKAIENKLGNIKDQIIIDIFEGGVRIQLVDKERGPMFDLGSAKPTSLAVSILRVIGDNIRFLPNSVAIEGHTDSLAYGSTDYGNWDLSTERALAAKKELEKNGLDPRRLIRVAGYADTAPLVKEDPKDLRNRRISIMLIFPNKSRNQKSE